MAKYLNKKFLIRFALLLALLLVAVLAVLSNVRLQQSQIVYDGATLRWNSIPFTDAYGVQINQAPEVQVEHAYYDYPLGGDFDLSLTVHKLLLPDQTVEKQFRCLRAATGLRYEGGVLYWDAVENATSYAVEVNGAIVANVTETQFPYAEDGDAIFRVKALGPTDSYYSFFSEVYSVRILHMVQNLQFDCNANLITWDPVADAAYYTVEINGNTYTASTNSYSFDAKGQSFTLRVQANSASTNRVYDSKFTEERSYVNLPTVTDLSVQEGVLCWSPSAGADAYRVTLNGQERVVTEPKIDDLLCNTVYTVTVQPISDRPYTYSYISETKQITVLTAPSLSVQEYRAEQVVFSWAASDQRTKDAVGQLYLNGTLLEDQIPLSAQTHSFTYQFPQAGSYTFRVRAADTENASQSAWSEEITVVRLQSVVRHTVNDDLLEKDAVSFIGFEEVAFAQSYCIRINGQVWEGNWTRKDIPLEGILPGQNGAATLNFSILPNTYEAEGVYYLAPLQAHEFTVRRLGVPPAYPLLTRHQISWTATANASAYLLTVFRDGEELQRVRVEDTVYNITSILETAGDYTFEVRALGDGVTWLSSDAGMEGKAVARLHVPQNLRISDENQRKLLRWGPVPHAQGYRVKVGDRTYSVTASNNPAFNLTDLATSALQQVTVTAVGGETGAWLVLDGASTAPITFCRLAAPTDVRVTNTHITWAAVENATIYDIYIDGLYAATVTNATELDHSALMREGGKTYTVQVRAHGSDETQFDGVLSGAVTVTRLAKPSNLRAEAGKGTLTWGRAPAGTKSLEIIYQYQLQEHPASVNSFTPDVTATGEYVFTVRFVGSGDATQTKSGTISSQEAEYIFRAEKLPTPVLTLVGNRLVASGTADDAVYQSDAVQYLKWCFQSGNSLTEKAGTDNMLGNLTAGASYTVYAKGGFFCPNPERNEIVFYLTSDVSSSVTVPQ